MCTLSRRALAVAAICCLFAFTVQPAKAEFSIVFDAGYGSSNSPGTGASAKMVVTLSDTVGGNVLLEMEVTNTTDTVNSVFGTATDGADESLLTGIAFDIPNPDENSLVDSSFTAGSHFDTFLTDVSMSPFGIFDGAGADNGNFLGGNPNGALAQGDTDTFSVEVDTDLSAADFEALWKMAIAQTVYTFDPFSVNDGGIKLGARFQDVNAGEGSDKLLGGLDPNDPVTVVPTPSSLALFVIGMVGAAGCSRRRRNRSRVMAG